MERRDRTLEFSALATAQLAQDLQLLLGIMIACVDSLSHRLGLMPPDPDFEELNEAMDSAFHLSRELLTVVGLHNACGPPVIDLRELVERCRGRIQRVLGDDIRLVMNVERESMLVKATPVHLEWLLLNLAANSRDAMPHGGTLHIEIASMGRCVGPHEGSVRTDRFARLTVRDQGGGITDDVKTRMFEPFFTTKTQATGLGLTSVAVTVRALNGWLYVEVLENIGTVVHVLLPLHSESTRVALSLPV